jgi:LemA protein
MDISYILLGLLGIIAMWFVSAYNSMVSLDTDANDALSNLDVFLLKRLDLTTQLIASVGKYVGHENDTLLKLVEARNKNKTQLEGQSSESQDVIALSQSSGALSGALPSLFALSEAYPDLKASNVIIDYQDKVTEIETSLEGSRRYYNATVKVFNEKIRSFPTVLITGFFEFAKRKEYFKVPEAQKESLNKVKTL